MGKARERYDQIILYTTMTFSKKKITFKKDILTQNVMPGGSGTCL